MSVLHKHGNFEHLVGFFVVVFCSTSPFILFLFAVPVFITEHQRKIYRINYDHQWKVYRINCFGNQYFAWKIYVPITKLLQCKSGAKPDLEENPHGKFY